MDRTPTSPRWDSPSRRSWLTRTIAGGGALAATGLVVSAATAPQEQSGRGRGFVVTDFGAVGDGEADDTASIQAAVAAAGKARGGRVHFPAGRYRLTGSVTVPFQGRLDLTGDGTSSVLLHENDEPALVWPEQFSCRECSIRHLTIESVKNDKSPGTAAIHCRGGAERTVFDQLNLRCDRAAMGSGVIVEKVMDTVTFDHCLIWGPIRGTGIRVPRGSAVLVFGGRIVGSDPYNGVDPASIGIHLTGDNGGVHVVGTDIIGLGIGLKIGDAGLTSNREIFLTHTTFDSCVHGLVQVDHSYTSIIGCWSASCDEEQILVEDSAEGAILSISGGTIFNGGAYERPGAQNGLVVRQGTFTLTGVNVRNNKGHGILVGPKVRDYAITGCRITDNGIAAILEGDGYAFTGNVLARNRVPFAMKATEGDQGGNVQR